MLEKIFITGASGTVGHYLVDQLAPDYHLYLLVRNEKNLRFDPKTRENITVINASLDEIGEQAALLKTMDYCIHVATAWGGAGTERINVERSHQLFALLDPDRIKRVIYFSTASILGRDLQVLPEAEQWGTAYIKTKYKCFVKLPESTIADRIVTVFPTLVFGGDRTHPYSHLSRAIAIFRKYAWLLGRINLEARFHYIHAHDIAAIVRYLLEAAEVKDKYVLGNEAVTVGEFTQRVAKYFGHNCRWQLTLKPKTIYGLAKLLGVKISDWDRFCLNYFDFSYNEVVNGRTLGIATEYGSIEGILAAWERDNKGGQNLR